MALRNKVAANPQHEVGKLHSADEAAEFLGIAPQTLAHWRVRGIGPRYYVLNSRCIRYSLVDIQTWLNDRVQESTAENEKP